MSMYPMAIPASPLGYGSALGTTTMYPTATMMPAAATVAYPTMMAASPAPTYYGAAPMMGSAPVMGGVPMMGGAPMMGGKPPGFMARHHQKKAFKEHEKAFQELNRGDSEDYYKHQSKAARHEYKFNRKAAQNPAMGGYGAAPLGYPGMSTYPGMTTYPGVSTYDSGYSATLYPAFNDFTYGGGYAYEPTYAAPGSPYGGFGGYGSGATWF